MTIFQKHPGKIWLIAMLLMVIIGVKLSDIRYDQGYEDAAALTSVVLTGICKSEGYDGGAYFNLDDPSDARCFDDESEVSDLLASDR